MSAVRFHIEIMLKLNAIKSHFNGSYDKQNPTLVFISYDVVNLYEMIIRFI